MIPLEFLRVGTWNMLRDRSKVAAVASAYALMDTRALDALCIQECGGYLKALASHHPAAERYALIAFTTDPGRGESAILVRRDLQHGPGHQVRATRSGWFTVRGGKTPPKYLTTVKVAGLRVVSGHTAPSVRWRGGRILGPVRRVISMRQFARACVRFARNHDGPLAILCDWNATPEARGRYTPHWIARKTGMRVVAPNKGTHGNRTIDYALVRDCDATARREKRRGSDHHAVIVRCHI